MKPDGVVTCQLSHLPRLKFFCRSQLSNQQQWVSPDTDWVSSTSKICHPTFCLNDHTKITNAKYWQLHFPMYDWNCCDSFNKADMQLFCVTWLARLHHADSTRHSDIRLLVASKTPEWVGILLLIPREDNQLWRYQQFILEPHAGYSKRLPQGRVKAWSSACLTIYQQSCWKEFLPFSAMRRRLQSLEFAKGGYFLSTHWNCAFEVENNTAERHWTAQACCWCGCAGPKSLFVISKYLTCIDLLDQISCCLMRINPKKVIVATKID